MPSLVCVPITVRAVEQALALAARAGEFGADLVEYRVDEFFSGSPEEADALASLVSRSPIPCVFTCRHASEGGSYDGDEQARVALFERVTAGVRAGEHPPRYLDVELATIERSANVRQKVLLGVDHPGQLRRVESTLVASSHDFSTRPPDVLRRAIRAADDPAVGVVKIAYRARSLRDSLELLDLPGTLPKPTIALGIGEFGLLTRVLAPKFAGLLTFASLHDTQATAPGQPTLHDLLELYRFRSINARTRVFGVVGWPVAHSLSPRVHNAAFARAELDAVYLPLPIAAGDDPDTTYASFRVTLLELIEHPRLDLSGCSVTSPFKEHLVALALDQGWEVSPIASQSGAGNTLTIDPVSRRVRVDNTDAPALLAILRDRGLDPAGLRVAILGAGGLGRALAHALAHSGAHVTIANRTFARARRVAEAVNDSPPGRGAVPVVVASGLDALRPGDHEVVVQCTSAELSPPGAEDPPLPGALPVPNWSGGQPGLFVETLYHPRQTRALRGARDAGWRVVEGLELFARQAALQSELWTGRPASPAAFLSDATPR